jgi:hypothetical protein
MQAPPRTGQVVPAVAHTPFTQQPPPQSFPPQQGCPGPPQTLHTLLLHTVPEAQVLPGQQGCPAEPHAWQTPPMQAPAAQAALLLQAPPSPTPL